MDAAEKYKNRYRAVIEYANGAMFNVAELDAWAKSNKIPVPFEKLLSFEGKSADYTPSRHYVPFEGLDVIIASAFVPEDMDPEVARLQLIAARDDAEPSDPVSRQRDLVMVRYDQLLLSAVYDGDLCLYDSLTMSRIDVEGGRLRYEADPDGYLQAAHARVMDVVRGIVKPEDLEQARDMLAQKFARLDNLAWAMVILSADAPPPGESRYRQILDVTRWLQGLGLPFRHSNGLPASQYKGVPVSGDDVRERQYLSVVDVQASAVRDGFWPKARVQDEPAAAQVHERVTVANLAWRLASHRVDDNPDLEASGNDDGLRRTIRIAMGIHGWQPDRIAGVIPHIAEMAQAGTITVRGMDGGGVNPPVEVLSAKPDAWWLTAGDAQHVVASLWPQVRRDTLTAVVETIAKRLHSNDYLAEFAFTKSLMDEMQRAIDSGELPINEQRNAEIWLNEYDVDEWLARERKPYRLGLVVQSGMEQAEMECAGRLTISEVGARLASETGIDAARWESTLNDAIRAGMLPLKNPRNLADALPYAVPKNLRAFYDRVDVADVNKLLDANQEWHVAYRFACRVQVNGVAISGESADTSSVGASRPLPQQRHQEQEVLRVIRELGYDPQQLPKQRAGTAGVKAAVKSQLKQSLTEAVFKKAWERLRAAGDIADA